MSSGNRPSSDFAAMLLAVFFIPKTDIFYAGVAGMLLQINGEFKIGKFYSFVAKFRSQPADCRFLDVRPCMQHS